MFFEIFILFILCIRTFHKDSAVFSQNIGHFTPDRFLNTVAPIIAVDNIGRFQGPKSFCIAQCFLFDHTVNAFDVFKERFAVFERQKRLALETCNSIVRHNADNQLPKFSGFFDDSNVTAVNHVS